MVYAPEPHKRGCIDLELTAGSYVVYNDRRWRVARTSGGYVEMYRKYEAPQIVDIDDVVPVNGGEGQ
jgi:hypothetical protein